MSSWTRSLRLPRRVRRTPKTAPSQGPINASRLSAIGFAILCGLLLAIVACGGKAPGGSTAVSSSAEPAREARRSSGKIDTPALLTKEEVSAIIGSPVTSLDSNSASHVTYKTANPMLEASLEAERKHGTADALQAMAGARTATNMLGGRPAAVAGLGDEAFFGAMSFLYVRSGDVVLTVTPPNLAIVAQADAHNRMMAAPMGGDEQRKAAADLSALAKNDPLQAGNAERDPMKGAIDVIHASSKPQGTEYETKAREMARAMASKALEKLGAART